MKIQLNMTQLLLGVVAVLLALNLVATLARPGSSPAAGVEALMPRAEAASVLRYEDFLITTNQNGDVLYIWRPGQILNDSFRTVESRRYQHVP